METLYHFSSPQLRKAHSGKVRESYHIDAKHRILVATDRLSCFDQILPSSFAGKGVLLTQAAKHWFQLTSHIIPNHFIKTVAPNISLVKEAEPICIEMIVRQFLTGSLWRAYEKGTRVISGVKLPDGMKKNEAFPQPIITPTTKEKIDRPISPEEIVASGLVDRRIYQEMEEVSLKLFQFGQNYCKQRGLLLVDTKYEFGLIGGKLALIDEIHTCDSSRFWPMQGANQQEHWMDKEFIRQWLLANPSEDLTVAPAVLQEAKRRYEEVFTRLFDENIFANYKDLPLATVAYHQLVNENMIKKGFVAIVTGSKGDVEFAQKLRDLLVPYNIAVAIRIMSAHKNGERILELAKEYNHSIEPMCVIAVAGRSNGLGGALAANLNVPVISCPPFKDQTDLQLNINSSLMMPSQTPALTAVYPEQAVGAALRVLNIPPIRASLTTEIQEMKKKLLEEDRRSYESFWQ